MPCSDYPPYMERYENPETKRRLDNATRAACEAFHLLTEQQISKLSRPVQFWWQNHQEEDRRRRAAEREKQEREQNRQTALAKLSPKERKALGF